MKIDNFNVTSASTEAAQGVQAERRGSGDAAAQLGRLRDQVSLSDAASRISHAVNDISLRRGERVNALAAAYRAGTYAVDSHAVSKKIVEASINPTGTQPTNGQE